MKRLLHAKKIFNLHLFKGNESPFTHFEIMEFIFVNVFKCRPSSKEQNWIDKMWVLYKIS